MEDIKSIKAKWSWGTTQFFFTDNSIVKLEHVDEEENDGWYIVGLWVNEECRKQGLAKRLIKCCLDVLPEGVTAKLSVEHDAPQWLRDFYLKNGLEILN